MSVLWYEFTPFFASPVNHFSRLSRGDSLSHISDSQRRLHSRNPAHTSGCFTVPWETEIVFYSVYMTQVWILFDIEIVSCSLCDSFCTLFDTLIPPWLCVGVTVCYFSAQHWWVCSCTLWYRWICFSSWNLLYICFSYIYIKTHMRYIIDAKHIQVKAALTASLWVKEMRYHLMLPGGGVGPEVEHLYRSCDTYAILRHAEWIAMIKRSLIGSLTHCFIGAKEATWLLQLHTRWRGFTWQ